MIKVFDEFLIIFLRHFIDSLWLLSLFKNDDKNLYTLLANSLEFNINSHP